MPASDPAEEGAVIPTGTGAKRTDRPQSGAKDSFIVAEGDHGRFSDVTPLGDTNRRLAQFRSLEVMS